MGSDRGGKPGSVLPIDPGGCAETLACGLPCSDSGRKPHTSVFDLARVHMGDVRAACGWLRLQGGAEHACALHAACCPLPAAPASRGAGGRAASACLAGSLQGISTCESDHLRDFPASTAPFPTHGSKETPMKSC